MIKSNTMQYPLEPNAEILIRKIQQYEPAFDYNKWMYATFLKRDTLKGILIPELEALYNYIKQNEIEISVSVGIGNISVIKCIPNVIETTKHLSILVSRAGYNTGGIFSINDRVYAFNVENLRVLHFKLILLWLLKEPKRGLYNETISFMKEIGFEDIIPRMSILYLPLTLAEYLKYVIQRREKLQRIIGNKLYPLYTLLQKHSWRIHKNEDENVIKIYNIDTEEKIPVNIRDKAAENLKIRDEYDDEDGIYILSTSNDISDIKMIDEFLHPYIPYTFMFFR